MFRRVLAALVGMALWGCGAAEEVRPELQPVHGQLTINGKPAEGAVVVLHPANGQEFDSRGSRPQGAVGADGEFRITTYQDGDGAPVGDYQVAVLWFGRNGAGETDLLGGAYSRPEQTNIRVTIAAGQSELEPIEIKGARLTRPARKNPGQNLDGL